MTKEFAIHMIALYRALPEKERAILKEYVKNAMKESFGRLAIAQQEFENTAWLAHEIGVEDGTKTISEGMSE